MSWIAGPGASSLLSASITVRFAPSIRCTLTLRLTSQALQDLQVDFGFIPAIGFQFIGEQPEI